MKTPARFCLIAGFAFLSLNCATERAITVPASNVPTDYTGKPYEDANFKSVPQKIPGKILCAYYDSGGEGIAYHDNTPKNMGSGTLNKPDGSYLNEFRKEEAPPPAGQ